MRITWEPFEENFMALETQFRDSIIIASRTADVTEIQRVHLRDARAAKNEAGKDYSVVEQSCFLTRSRSGEKGPAFVALGHRFR